MTNKPQFVGETRRKIRLNELCTKGKSSLRQKDISNGGPYAVYGASGIVGSMDSFQNAVPYVAVVKDGAGVGRTSACAANTSVLGTMQALIPTDGTNRDYLLHLIKSLRLGDDFSGSTIPHIYFKDYGKTLVPFHNPVEQQRIVDILSTVERQIEGSKQQLDQLDNLVKSRFVEMFGDPSTDTNRWQMLRLDAFTQVVTGNTPSRKEPGNYGTGIEWVKTDNIANLTVTAATEQLTEVGRKKARIAPAGSILMACIAGSVRSIGKVGLLDREAAFNQQINAIIPGQKTNSRFLLVMLSLSKDYLCQSINMQLKGILNKSALSAKVFPLPPLALQQEFAAFVAQVDKSRFAYIWSRTKSVEQALSGPSLTLVIQHVEPQTRSKYKADVLASPSWPSVGAALVQNRRTFAF